MHSRLLNYFLMVYDFRSISLAAEKLRISQPALTKSVQQLETSIGVTLFERLSRGVRATRYADILARRVRLMDTEYRHALAEIEVARGGGAGLIRIGAGPVWCSCILPPIIAQLRAERPEIRIRVQGGVIDTLVPGLRSGRFDLICTSFDFPAQSDFLSEMLVEMRHVVVAAPDHAILGAKPAQARDMTPFDWIVLTDDKVGTGRLLGYFAAHGEPPPRIAVETSSLSHMFELMHCGPFLAQIPEAMLPLAARFGLVRVDPEGTFWHSPAGICYRPIEHHPRALSALIEAIRRSMRPAALT